MKPRVAFFDFTGCEGCQLEVLNFNLEIVDLIGAVDIVEFREASSDHSDNYDIAFIEGSITTEKEIERVQGIRKKAKILVALGACACTGRRQRPQELLSHGREPQAGLRRNRQVL